MAQSKRHAVKVGSMIYNALVILTGRGPLAATEFGENLWFGRKRGKTTSMGGGGDFGAQMFLGKMRARGFARTTHDPGSSRWEVTPAGRNALAAALAKHGQIGDVQNLMNNRPFQAHMDSIGDRLTPVAAAPQVQLVERTKRK